MLELVARAVLVVEVTVEVVVVVLFAIG